MALADADSLDGNVDFVRLSASPSPSSGPKRKRDVDLDEVSTEKRKKRKKTRKPKDAVDEDLDEELGLNAAIGRMDARLLCDVVAQKTKRFEPELSAVELDDMYIPVKAVRETSDWTKVRSTDLLPEFLKSCAKNGLTQAPKQKGHPHTIVVAAAGLRAADLTRVLRVFETKDVKVAKLFAKHIKLKEAIESCKKLKMNIGVGTPHRIHDLLDNGMSDWSL